MAVRLLCDTALGLIRDPTVDAKIAEELIGRQERHRRVWRLDEQMPLETATA